MTVKPAVGEIDVDTAFPKVRRRWNGMLKLKS